MAERVTTLEGACCRLDADPSLLPVAGGTDLMVASIAERALRGALLDLSAIEALRGVSRDGDRVVVGAATTFSQLQSEPLIEQHFPSLIAAAREVGGWQIQNRATIGGNVANASPAGDSLPVLLALDATVVCVGSGGERRVSYDDFHVGYRQTALRPGELIARIELPVPAGHLVQRFRKVGTREAQAISKVVLAMAGRCESGRIVDLRLAAGSVAATPIRLRSAEAAALGLGPLEGAVAASRAAIEETTPIADVRSTAQYRSVVLGRLVGRFVASFGGHQEEDHG